MLKYNEIHGAKGCMSVFARNVLYTRAVAGVAVFVLQLLVELLLFVDVVSTLEGWAEMPQERLCCNALCEDVGWVGRRVDPQGSHEVVER